MQCKVGIGRIVRYSQCKYPTDEGLLKRVRKEIWAVLLDLWHPFFGGNRLCGKLCARIVPDITYVRPPSQTLPVISDLKFMGVDVVVD